MSVKKTDHNINPTWVIFLFILGIIGGAVAMAGHKDRSHATAVDKLMTLVSLEQEAAELRHEQEIGQALANQRRELLEPTLFKPVLTLSESQNTLCLAIALFGEERMGSELDMVTIAHTLVNRAMDRNWKESNICSVAVASYDGGKTLQYSSMGPFKGDIHDIVWGNMDSFTPYLARKNESDMLAWQRILTVADNVIKGQYPLMTTANHFVSLRELRSVPDWLRALRPVGVTTGHVLLVDYELRDGIKMRYTADNPFNQAEFNKQSWEMDLVQETP